MDKDLKIFSVEGFLEQGNYPDTLSGGTLKVVMRDYARLHVDEALKQQAAKNKRSSITPIVNQFGTVLEKGLNKREYFAGLLLQGICSNQSLGGKNANLVSVSIALADELLKQLDKNEQ